MHLVLVHHGLIVERQTGYVMRIPYDIFKCSDHQRVSILACYCATYNEAKDIIEVGKCIYNTVLTPENLQYHTKNFRLLKMR